MTLTASRIDDAIIDRIAAIVGAEHVSRSDLDRRAYARDLWPLEMIRLVRGGEVGHPPCAVAWPADVEQLAALVRLCHEERIPCTPYAGGSGVCGGAVPIRGGLSIDVKRLEKILRVEPDSLLVEAQAGVMGPVLEDELNRHGLTLGHFPSSIHCSTLGGWLAARSAGQCSSRYGKIEDMVRALEVVLPTGEVAAQRMSPRRATGPDFAQLFVGSEGTLGFITRATMRCWPAPRERVYRSYTFSTAKAGLDGMRRMLQAGLRPAVVRLYDELDTLLVARKGEKAAKAERRAAAAAESAPPAAADDRLEGEFLPGDADRVTSAAGADASGAPWRLGSWLEELAQRGGRHVLRHAAGLISTAAGALPVSCLLVLVFEGDHGQAEFEANAAEAIFREVGGVSRGEGPARRWEAERYSVSYKQSRVFARGLFNDTMEVASSWTQLDALYAGVRAAIGKHAIVLAHFSHAYPEGCSIYFTFVADAGDDPAKMERLYRTIWKDALTACVAAGGTISHHHGVGLSKAEFMAEEHGGMMTVFQRIKDALDPHGIMNPGKLGLRESTR